MGPIQYDWYLYKKGNLDIEIGIEEKQYEETQEEEDHLQTKERELE